MDGSGARYSGVMYRSPLDPLVAADVMAAEVNRDLKGHLTMASNEGGDKEWLGVGGATCLLGGLLPLSADLVSLFDVVSFCALSSRIVIGAFGELFCVFSLVPCPSTNHSFLLYAFLRTHTGFETNLCRQ